MSQIFTSKAPNMVGIRQGARERGLPLPPDSTIFGETTPTPRPLPMGPTPGPAFVGLTEDDPRRKRLGILQRAGDSGTIVSAPGGDFSASKLG